MKIPVPIKIAALVVVTTIFYTYVGQLVPQKEVPAPEVVEISQDMTTEELVDLGKKIFEGKGLCSTCHTLGESGALRFPDLGDIAVAAETRKPGMSALDYIAESMYDPNIYIVPGFLSGMPQINKPPIALSDPEILAVMAYLQTLGGTATITPDTQIAYLAGE